MLNIPT